MNIQLSTNLFSQFSAEDMKNKETAWLVSSLYTLASAYEEAQKEVVRIVEQIQECLGKILKGETPWYDVTSKAIELERQTAIMKAKKEAFCMIVKVAGHTFIEG